MPKFVPITTPTTFEQWHASDNPETWHRDVKWGGDLPDGVGCYVVTTVNGRVVKIHNDDWFAIEDSHGQVLYVLTDEHFRRTYEPHDDPMTT